eukprot:scaffold72762_cov63-Phaeocystis_antarctica.AAC.5
MAGVLSPLLLHSRPATRSRHATAPQATAGLFDLLPNRRASEFDMGSSDKFFSGAANAVRSRNQACATTDSRRCDAAVVAAAADRGHYKPWSGGTTGPSH